MPTFNLHVISENKPLKAEADTFESALEIFEQKLRVKLTFDGDGESPYIMDKAPTHQESAAWIDPSRHVYLQN
jgi:hypothetical protein